MLCPKCANAVPEGSMFCNHCGKKLIKEKRPVKRPNNLGSVYYDARAKRWIAQIVVGRTSTKDAKLRFQYKRKYCKTKTEALSIVQELEQEANKAPAFTVSYYYNAFSKGKGDTLSHDKQVAYRIAYNRLKKIHGKPIRDLTITMLQDIVNDSCDSYYPARDVRTLLNAMFRLAAADDRQINPILPKLIQLPKMQETQVEPFTEEEQLQLWYAYESGKWSAAIPLIMIYTGMMTGEIRRLTKDMVILSEKKIDHAVGLKTQERKKKAVLLPDDIIPVLEDVISKAENDLLFPMTEGKFYELYYQTLKDAGITRHLTPYSCRHTTATVLAVHDNVAPQTLQRVMRWKSTRMMDRYVTPDDQDAMTAVNKI